MEASSSPPPHPLTRTDQLVLSSVLGPPHKCKLTSMLCTSYLSAMAETGCLTRLVDNQAVNCSWFCTMAAEWSQRVTLGP
eukprot:8093909-Alexandrium_andersonii.AAC.1